jgi:hypothetical protein
MGCALPPRPTLFLVDWTLVIFGLVVIAFFGLIAWLRTDSSGQIRPPGEPGDLGRESPDDVRW